MVRGYWNRRVKWILFKEIVFTWVIFNKKMFNLISIQYKHISTTFLMCQKLIYIWFHHESTKPIGLKWIWKIEWLFFFQILPNTIWYTYITQSFVQKNKNCFNFLRLNRHWNRDASQHVPSVSNLRSVLRIV